MFTCDKNKMTQIIAYGGYDAIKWQIQRQTRPRDKHKYKYKCWDGDAHRGGGGRGSCHRDTLRGGRLAEKTVAAGNIGVGVADVGVADVDVGTLFLSCFVLMCHFQNWKLQWNWWWWWLQWWWYNWLPINVAVVAGNVVGWWYLENPVHFGPNIKILWMSIKSPILSKYIWWCHE